MIDSLDRQLINLLQQGLPLVSRPYLALGEALQLTEDEVLSRLSSLKKQGVIKRLGVIVNHRRLGYTANAMVVFDIPQAVIDRVGGQMSQLSFVNLCYQRPSQGSQWPYNLYCMIHGKNKDKVRQQLQSLIQVCQLEHYRHEILFSKQCFKQRGALYQPEPTPEKLVTDG
jgi:DNA-binding Lrp family transcriptional regulator